MCYLRTLAETDELSSASPPPTGVVVIGAGFIGLEFAAVARGPRQGRPYRRAGRPGDGPRRRRADLGISSPRRIARTGVEFGFGAQAARIAGHAGGPRGQGRPCRAGRRRAARPPTSCSSASASCPTSELAAAAGLEVANGIVVDASWRPPIPTSRRSAIARRSRRAIAEGAATRLEAVQNAADHARCVADRLVGKPHALHRAAVVLERAGRAQIADRRAVPPGSTGRSCAAMPRAAGFPCSATRAATCSASS